jgi:hypothetical protein
VESIKHGVNSAKLRPILTMKDRFLSDSSVSGWSSDPNEMPTSDHFILLPGSIH